MLWARRHGFSAIVALGVGVMTPQSGWASSRAEETNVPGNEKTTDVQRKGNRPGVFGALGLAGLGFASAGAFAVGFGAARNRQGEKFLEGELFSIRTSYRLPVTDATLVLGAIAVGAGITMLVVDLAICGRRPQGCRLRRASTQARGVGWALRF